MGRRWACVLAALVFVAVLGSGAAHAATETVAPKPKPEPVLLLRNFRTTPATLTVGSRFKLELFLENAVDVTAENVLVTVGSASVATSTSSLAATPTAGGPDVVVLGSNSRFVGKITGGTKNRVVSFDLVSNPQGFPGPYALPVTIQFDSRNGGRLTSAQSVGLEFTRTLVFDVGALTYPKTAMVGKTFNISVDVRNTNPFPINGVEISFESSACDWVSRETSVGTLVPGATGQLVATAIPQSPGPLLVTLHITYKDDYNNTKRIDRDLTVQIEPKPVERKVVKQSIGDKVVLFMKALIGLGG